VKSILANADRLLIASGQRNYFYEQKEFYLTEMRRLTDIFQKAYIKKRNYKSTLKEKEEQFKKAMESCNQELIFLREKISCDKNETVIQTDIDVFEFSKIKKNNDLVVLHKRLVLYYILYLDYKQII